MTSNIELTAGTWTQVSTATTNTIILQSGTRDYEWFYYWLGTEPTTETGFYVEELILNNGTYGEELWVYSSKDITLVAHGVVGA